MYRTAACNMLQDVMIGFLSVRVGWVTLDQFRVVRSGAHLLQYSLQYRGVLQTTIPPRLLYIYIYIYINTYISIFRMLSQGVVSMRTCCNVLSGSTMLSTYLRCQCFNMCVLSVLPCVLTGCNRLSRNVWQHVVFYCNDVLVL